MSEVTEAEFKDIMSNAIELGKCPKCGIGGGDILIRMPWYGKTGVCVKCPYCGHETKTYGISEVIFCGKKMATPFTQKAIMRGILQAVKKGRKTASDMARYIDAELFADRLLNAWTTADKEKKFEIVAILANIVTPILAGTPTADVAPRAEVANKICCEIEEEIVAALESNYRALKEWDDGRCNDYILEMVNRIKGKIDALRGMEAFVEELKNKYAEVQK